MEKQQVGSAVAQQSAACLQGAVDSLMDVVPVDGGCAPNALQRDSEIVELPRDVTDHPLPHSNLLAEVVDLQPVVQE